MVLNFVLFKQIFVFTIKQLILMSLNNNNQLNENSNNSPKSELNNDVDDDIEDKVNMLTDTNPFSLAEKQSSAGTSSSIPQGLEQSSVSKNEAPNGISNDIPSDTKIDKKENQDENKIIVNQSFVEQFIKEYKNQKLHERKDHEIALFDQKELQFVEKYKTQILQISLFLINMIQSNADQFDKDENNQQSSKSATSPQSEASGQMNIYKQLFFLITSYIKYGIQKHGAEAAFQQVGVKSDFNDEEKKVLSAQNASILAK